MGLLVHHRTSLVTLIASAQREPCDDSPAMNEIVARFEPLTRRLARGMTASAPELYDDIANACRSGLVRAVRRHDTRRAGFPRYAERFMRGAGLRELKFWTRGRSDLQLEGGVAEAVANQDDVLLDALVPWGDGAVAAAIAGLATSQRQIAELRYVDDRPLKQIAAEVGTSVPAVSQRLGTIHRAVALALAA